jgi:hypothetical protein
MINKENADLRFEIFRSGFTYREIAKKMRITPVWLCRAMAHKLTPEMRRRINCAIDELSGDKRMTQEERAQKRMEAVDAKQKKTIKDQPVTITNMLTMITDQICDNYCKYPGIYLSEHPGEEVDMLEDMMYTEICANCPLMKI